MAQTKQFALICQYDGTSYQGFQSQRNQNTIQDKIEFMYKWILLSMTDYLYKITLLNKSIFV